MAQITIPNGVTEIYRVDAQSGVYDRTEGFACNFESWREYPKYFTDYDEAKKHYDSIEIDNHDFPQRKEISTISLIDSVPDEEEETD